MIPTWKALKLPSFAMATALILAVPTAAQIRPAVSGAVAGGIAPRGGVSAQGGFVGSASAFGDVDLRLEIPRNAARWAVFASVDRSVIAVVGNDKICIVAAAGGCVPRYPNIRTLGLSVGWLSSSRSAWRLQAGAGVGKARDDDSDAVATEWDAQLALERRLIRHLDAEVTVRPMRVGSLNANRRLWACPISLGLRVR
jgi:hypothetical protein